MAFIWSPGIWRSAALWLLPRPIHSLTVTDEWDVDRQKAIKVDGEQVTGHSLKGVMINVSGCINIQNAAEKTDESAQWGIYETLRTKCDVSADGDKYEFFIYYDTSGGGTYRKYKSVSCLSLIIDIGDEKRIQFPYTAQFVADDPVIYTTAGGA